ncbi:MAG TPA: HAMP domain-containing sensor histidine kinase [Burkholderiales bacterium]|nr:HAMP domain-containing sensor histidine kinase [Burkholderiales bacterium]
MRLSIFITENLEQILAEWESFAASLLAPGQAMTSLALRDHASQILLAIAEDIETSQTQLEQAYKSKGFVQIAQATRTAAMTHGALRHLAGFDLRQLAAEFRALRASVLRLWLKHGAASESAFYEMTRFNEAIDQALAESISNYSNEAARSRDTFLAILGHDLRSPLSAIANSGLYLTAPGLLPTGAPLEAARRVTRSAARMSIMIRDLLEYTRARLGRSIPITSEAGDMEQICRMAYDEIRAIHPERLFRLKMSGDLNGRFDADRLQQVLANLLNNAVRHGDKNEPITLSADGDAEKITLQVENHGRPIPPDQLQVIFNPLVQIPSALTDEDADSSTSLGLGLYIAREIVAMHGGTIEAESTGSGTVFSARLPRARAEARL